MKDPQSFIASIGFDERLAPYDIEGSIAHVTMLSKRRILKAAQAKRIISGLRAIGRDLARGRRIPPQEDIHFAIEKELIRRTGDAGRMMHTGRSRNDQVATDLHLYLKARCAAAMEGISRLQAALVDVADRHREVVMPGFTHLQHAQPVLFAHHLLAYAWMLERDKGRFADARKRADVLPLGSAALAGTSFPIDRHMVARLLKFKSVSENSMDATSSRDAAAEFLSAAAILMSTLSRLAEELVVWSSAEFSFVRLADPFTSGSSIMPQKRNPDVAEIVRGQSGRVYGSLVAMLTILKGLPLSYNRDLQEDKPPLFDADDTITGCLAVTAPMVRSMKVNAAAMERWCGEGFLAATELADYLAVRGVPFRAAHGVVREIVAHCEKKGIGLEGMTLAELRLYHPRFDAGALSILTPETVVRAKTSYGGTSPASVRRQIARLRALLRRRAAK